jgi:hypothetical protein
MMSACLFGLHVPNNGVVKVCRLGCWATDTWHGTGQLADSLAAYSSCSGTRLRQTRQAGCARRLHPKKITSTNPPDRLRPLHRLYRPHLLLSARCRATTDCVRGTTCVHIGAPGKKLSFTLPPRFNYLFIFAILEYSGLRHYNITANTPDTRGCAITSLPQIHRWIYFLRL